MWPLFVGSRHLHQGWGIDTRLEAKGSRLLEGRPSEPLLDIREAGGRWRNILIDRSRLQREKVVDEVRPQGREHRRQRREESRGAGEKTLKDEGKEGENGAGEEGRAGRKEEEKKEEPRR